MEYLGTGQQPFHLSCLMPAHPQLKLLRQEVEMVKPELNIDYHDNCVHTEENDVQVPSSVDSALVQQEAAALEPTD